MSAWVWQRPELVHLLWAALAVVGILGWLEVRGRDRLRRYVSSEMAARLALAASPRRRVARLLVIFACLVFGVIALMRPQAPGQVERERGTKIRADVMIALDVSKSMLAEDAAPSRLARAKAEISSLLEELAGQRVGLVAFAGSATRLSPLTPDYGFFRMMLRGADTRSVSRGGTKIGEAVRKALASFDEDTSVPRLLLLITDGEDHDSYPREAAEEAAEKGVRIISIAFGSEEGSEITLRDPETGARSVLTHEGEPVISRVDGELLRDMALATEGAYVPAGVAALDLASIVDEHVEPMVEEIRVDSVRVVRAERYPGFVLASLVSLLTAVWLGAAPGRRRS